MACNGFKHVTVQTPTHKPKQKESYKYYLKRNVSYYTLLYVSRMKDNAYEAEGQQTRLETECSVEINPDMIGKAKEIADKIMISRSEFFDINSGVHYKFSFEKGDKYANMQIKSLFMYPSEETKIKTDLLIKEIRYAVQKEPENGLKTLLRQSS